MLAYWWLALTRNGDAVEFDRLIAALRSGWRLPVLGIVVGVVIAVGLSFVQPSLYTASTQLFVSTTGNTTTTDALSGSQFSEERVTSYARLIEGRELAGRVINRLGLPVSADDLSREITATAATDTVLINVAVTDRSAKRAQQIAAAVGQEFTKYSKELEATNSSGTSPVKVTVTEQPDLPTSPSSPKTLPNGILGGLIGLVAGAALAFGRVRLDRSVRDGDESAALIGAPVVGTVLRDEHLEKQHTIDKAASGRTAEDYRQLRNNLQFIRVDEPPKVIMVSSALPGEGKTTLVINLGIALAEAGQRVTVIEADLRRPKVTRYLGMVSGVGLTNVLVGNADIEDVSQSYRENMSVIAAGPNPPNPGELLASSHMASIIDKLRGQNDFVLIDAPPLLPVADSSGLAVHVDGVLLSVKYGSTRKDQLRQAAATLERVGATTLGVVLNIVPPKAGVATAYGYGYGYGYADAKHAK